MAERCDPGLDPLGSGCFFDRVGTEVRATAYRDGQVVQVVSWRFAHPLGC